MLLQYFVVASATFTGCFCAFSAMVYLEERKELNAELERKKRKV